MRRVLGVAAALAAGALVLLALAGVGTTQSSSATAASARGGGAASASPNAVGGDAATMIARGRALFLASCSSCHGMDARGIPGRGPNLRGVGALAADFYLRTGRMPLPAPHAQPLRTRPAFPASDIAALTAYVGSFGGPPVPQVVPSAGSLARGQDLFALNCAGCHTIQAQGGIVTGAIAPSLQRATPTEIAEAIRIGPYVMPSFGASEISGSDIDAIARYVQSTQHPADNGGWGIGRIGPIPEGMVAWLIAIAALLVVARLIGERSERSRP